MTVAELLSRISSKEISEWIAFTQTEPFGYDVEMFGHAQTAMMIAEVNRDHDKNPGHFTIKEFMPDLEGQARDPDEQAKALAKNLMQDLKPLKEKKE